MTQIDIDFAIEFLTHGTNSNNIFEAEDNISASQEYQDIIQQEFGMHYEDLLDIIWQHYHPVSASPFEETV